MTKDSFIDMTLKIENYGLCVKTYPPQINFGDRGFVSKISRTWHRHNRNQTDYFLITKGKMNICISDENNTSETFGKLVKIHADGDDLKIVKVPGHFWHGTKTIGSIPSKTIYFFTNLYDYENPEEERMNLNSEKIIDPITNLTYDWNKQPYK